jgi:hypothetical protein
MTENETVMRAFYLLSHGSNAIEDEVRLYITKAIAFYSKKSHQVDAFNAMIASIEHEINAKHLIHGKEEN